MASHGRKRKDFPSLTRHGKSGQGRVRLSGQDFYCGPWPAGLKEAPSVVVAEYHRHLAEWATRGRRPLPRAETEGKASAGAARPTPEVPTGVTVAELCVAYMRHAEKYYREPGDGATSEVDNLRYSLRPLVHLYGDRPARTLRPRRLKAVRQLMVDGYEHPTYGTQAPLSRRLVNARVGRVVRMYKWAVEEELVPERSWLRLSAVRPLQKNRSGAREGKKVRPAVLADVQAALPHLRPQPRGAARLQLYTGLRAGEALSLRPRDLLVENGLLLWRPEQHKTEHHDIDKVVVFGPKARAVLAEFIRVRCPCCGAVDRPARLQSPDGARCGACARAHELAGACGPFPRVVADPDTPIFSPIFERAERYADLRAGRKSKVQPSQESRKKKKPSLVLRARYSTTNYQNAIRRACKKAGVPPWTSHQLRHHFATLARRACGLEGAQAALGHARADTTEIYAEKSLQLAARVAEEIG